MRRLPVSLDATVSAFRDLTAPPGEGGATRSRVLARAGRDARRRTLTRRGLLAMGVALAVLSSSAVLTAAALRWRAPAAVYIDQPEAPPARAAHTAHTVRIVPPLAGVAEPLEPSARDDGEPRAYERAHRAHFFAEQPASALAAWDEYLAAYPRGTFVPEARYNRALCLVRLGRVAAAAHELRPFAAGRLAGYRRREACLLLRWLVERGAPAAPPCGAAN